MSEKKLPSHSTRPLIPGVCSVVLFVMIQDEQVAQANRNNTFFLT